MKALQLQNTDTDGSEQPDRKVAGKATPQAMPDEPYRVGSRAGSHHASSRELPRIAIQDDPQTRQTAKRTHQSGLDVDSELPSSSVASGPGPAETSWASSHDAPLGAGMASSQCSSRVALTRNQVWALLDNPNSSSWAYVVAVFIMVLIGVSSTAFVVETLPEFRDGASAHIWQGIEIVCIFFFTVEFLGRLLSAPNTLEFVRSPLNIIDFLAVVPFYIELALGSTGIGGSSAVFRVVRLVRVFRVFKLSRYLSWVKVFTKAMSTSLQPLIMLLVVVLIGMVIFSTAIYYAEQGVYDERRGCNVRSDGLCTPYESIPASFWWCIITMTTVGYGDHVPVTPLGKVVAVVTSFSGLLVLAIPITIISTNFNEQYDKLKRSRHRVRARMMLLKNQFQTKRTGLDAMLDEVDELVQRNTMELRKDVEDLFEQSALELKEEMKSLVRIAHRKRKQLRAKADRESNITRISSLDDGAVRLTTDIPPRQRNSMSSSSSSAAQRCPGSIDSQAGISAHAEADLGGISPPTRLLRNDSEEYHVPHLSAHRDYRSPGHAGAMAPRSDSPPEAKHTNGAAPNC